MHEKISNLSETESGFLSPSYAGFSAILSTISATVCRNSVISFIAKFKSSNFQTSLGNFINAVLLSCIAEKGLKDKGIGKPEESTLSPSSGKYLSV